MPSPSSPGAPHQQGRRARRAAAAVAVTATTIVLAGLPSGIASANPATPHALGLQRSYTGVSATTGMGTLAAAAAAQGGAIRAATTLPATVNLRGYAVPAGDQGSHGACVSWTTGYTIAGWESNYTHHAGAPFAPMSVYNQVNDGSDDLGTDFPSNWSVLENRGDVEAAAWSHPFSDFTSQPDAAEKANAAQHRLSAHTTLFNWISGIGPDAQTIIETALANNQPVGIALPVFDSFFSLNQSDSTWTGADADADDAQGRFAGWHAVTILGYDSYGVTVENSWGTGWGNDGFATFDWDFVERYVPEAYAAGSFTVNGLTPTVDHVSQDVVSTAGGEAVDLTVSRLSSVDPTASSAVQFVSVEDPTVRVDAPVDPASVTDTTLTVTAPALPAPGQYRVVVTGYNGAGVPNGTDDVVSAVDPGTVALLPGQYGRSNAAAWVTLGGLGFGATSGDFTANDITATVDGAAAAVQYVDDNHVAVQVPAAAVGSTASIVVSFAGSDAPAVSVTYAPPVPVVSSLQPAHVADAGGTVVTVTVADGTSLGSTPTVTLQGITDPTLTVPVTVTGVSGSTLTFTAPAIVRGNPRDYDLVVSGDGGTSTVLAADRFGYRPPFGGHATVTQVSPAGGNVPVAGLGYGGNASQFAANHLTATVGGRAAALHWISNQSVTVTFPPGTPGRYNNIVLVHDGVPGPTILGPRYGALVGGNSTPVGPSRGWTTVLSGAGFAGSGGWYLTDSAGRRVANLPVVGSRLTQQRGRGPSVYLTLNYAIVKLPALRWGNYRIAFSPSQRNYPGAKFMASNAAVLYYR